MTTTLPAIKTEGVDAFLNTHGGPAGEFIRFTKEAKFARLDGEEVPVGTKLIVVFPETQHGWIKFNGPGQPPTRHMGGMFSGYVPPPRSELGDNDPSSWEEGLSGKPQDPWKSQVLLPLKEADGERLFIPNVERYRIAGSGEPDQRVQTNVEARAGCLSGRRAGRRRVRAQGPKGRYGEKARVQDCRQGVARRGAANRRGDSHGRRNPFLG